MTECDTADRLLDAAEALLVEHGPDGFSLREVARRTGVTPMAVYGTTTGSRPCGTLCVSAATAA